MRTVKLTLVSMLFCQNQRVDAVIFEKVKNKVVKHKHCHKN